MQTRTGSLLHRDHMETVGLLQEWEEILDANRKPPEVNGPLRPMLERLVTSLKAEVEDHFSFEENNLFPVFLELGQTGIVGVLTQEHRSILPLANKTAELASRALAEGFDTELWREFNDYTRELIEREIFHIQKEEMGLLAAISALVDDATDQRLAVIYEQGKASA